MFSTPAGIGGDEDVTEDGGGSGGGERGGGGVFHVMFEGKAMLQEDVDKIKADRISKGSEYYTKTQKKNLKRRIAKRNNPYTRPVEEGSDQNPTSSKTIVAQGNLTDSPAPTTPVVNHQFTIFTSRNDEEFLDLSDISHIKAEIAAADIKIMKQHGRNSYDICQTFQKGLTFDLICNTEEAVGYYKSYLNQHNNRPLEIEGKPHKGYTAHDVHDKPMKYQITGEIHRSHSKHKDDLHFAFAGGSRGNVTTSQVKQFQSPVVNPAGNLRVFIELDEPAFLWLKSEGWWSRIGATQVRWCAPNAPGVRGRYAPDTDFSVIMELEAAHAPKSPQPMEAQSSSTLASSPDHTQSHQETFKPIIIDPEEIAPTTDFRPIEQPPAQIINSTENMINNMDNLEVYSESEITDNEGLLNSTADSIDPMNTTVVRQLPQEPASSSASPKPGTTKHNTIPKFRSTPIPLAKQGSRTGTPVQLLSRNDILTPEKLPQGKRARTNSMSDVSDSEGEPEGTLRLLFTNPRL